MFGVAREFQAPFGVTHALRGRFIPSSNALGVIFARKNSLDFNVVRANQEVARLELLQSTPLGANVFSMDVLRRSSASVDLLCIGFSHLRVAIMAWDHDTREWTTEQTIDLGSQLGGKLCSPSSIMRSLDPSDYGRPILRGKVGNHGNPLIRTDPSGRCFAVHAKGQNTIYIVPVRSEEDSGRSDSRIVNRDEMFLIDLPTEYEASNVKDFAFLQGSFEPNILVLYEPKRTWSGRAAIQRNTCHLLNLSVDIRSRRHSKTWTMDHLPYDSQRILPVPESAGSGALLLSTSVLMQVRHGACVAGLSLNNFGDAYTTEVKGRYDTITQSDTIVECDAAHCRFLDYEERLPDAISPTQSVALMSLKGGELYFLSVAVGSRNLLVMKRAGSTVIASEIVPINERFFVLASRLSDSLLVEYQESLDVGRSNANAEKSEDKDESSDEKPAEKPKARKRRKRQRTAEEEAEYEMIYGVKPPEESSDEESVDESGKPRSALELEEKDEGTRGVYDDDDELGWVFNAGGDDESGSGKGTGTGTWALKVKDTITCFGPGSDIAIGASPDDLTNTKLDMVIAGGYAKNGCLAVVHQSIRPTIRTEFEVEGCSGVWTLQDPFLTQKEKGERDARNNAAVRRNAARRARNTKMLAARKRFVEEEIDRFLKEKERNRIEALEKEDENDSNTITPDPESSEQGTESKNVQVTRQEEEENMNNNGGAPDSENPAAEAQDLDNRDSEDPPTKKRKLRQEEEAKNETPNGSASHSNGLEVPDEFRAQLEQQAEEKFLLEEEEALEEGISEDNSLHAYMLLSTATKSTVLKTGAEIEELMGDSAGFTTHERTIAAANVLANNAIVQVTPTVVKVLSNGTVQSQYQLAEEDSGIKKAQISDPFILLETEKGTVQVLTVRAEEIVENEGESKAAQNHGSVAEQEDIFDEYGVAVAASESKPSAQSNVNGADTIANGSNSSPTQKEAGKTITCFRDFKIDIEYCHSSEGKQLVVSAAYLYKGPLATDLAKNGMFNMKQPQSPTEQTEKNSGSGELDVNSKEPLETTEGQDSEMIENGQVEDEDRLLYGDDKEDEEDLMLYGAGDPDSANGAGGQGTAGDLDMQADKAPANSNANVNRAAHSNAASAPAERGVISMAASSLAEESESHLLVLCSTSGVLQVLCSSLGWQVVLECPTFFAAPNLVSDMPMSKDDKLSGKHPFASKDLEISNVAMMELAGSALMSGLSTPFLIAISKTGLPMIYRAFLSSKLQSANERRSKLCFHRIISRDRTASLLARSIRSAQRSAKTQSSPDNVTETRAPIYHFQNIAGRSGALLGGPCPIFLFAERGYPRIHALSHANTGDEPVSKEEYDAGQTLISFAEFHNVKCPRGFVSVAKEGVVRIGELSPPSAINYDAPAPVKKVALRCTPHKVAYHDGSATYGVLASMPTLTTREDRLLRILQSLEKHDKRHYQHTAAQAEAETGDDRADRGPPLFEELHELRVYRPDTWELIKSHKLQTGEVGLAIANMKVDVFKQQTAASGAEIPSSKKDDDGNESTFAASLKMRPKDMLVVGTGYLNGEDASSRGRLLMFEVSRQEAYTEGGGVYTAFQLQLIAEKELFSPVTAVASMEGYVIAGVGPQISVYKLVGDEIIHLSFAFGQLYCTSLASIKQYVVAADMCKSVSFMYFRDRNNSVNFLGKDYEHVTCMATEFLIENENMSIVVSDGKGNLQLMTYAHASEPESRGGKRLLKKGGICFGSRINKFVRLRSPDSHGDLSNGRAPVKAGIHSLLYATLDGGIGALVSSTEVQFRKLRELYDVVVEHSGIQRRAGVNPVEQTAFQAETASSVLLDQRMLDSRALFDVFSVTLIEMRMIARKIGTDLEGLAQLIMDLDVVLSRF